LAARQYASISRSSSVPSGPLAALVVVMPPPFRRGGEGR
jgi:hypothetical protein